MTFEPTAIAFAIDHASIAFAALQEWSGMLLASFDAADVVCGGLFYLGEKFVLRTRRSARRVAPRIVPVLSC